MILTPVQIARRCAIHTPPTRMPLVGSHAVILVKWFDRQQIEPDKRSDAQYLLHHMVSAL